MRRFHLSFLLVVMAAASAARADSTSLEQRRAEACKILLQAQATAHEITSPSDRNAALTAIGEALIRAGNETGALAIDRKLDTAQTPRPILKALALAQLRSGRVDDALFIVRTMKDQDASDSTLMALAQTADDLGDPEMAVRLCKLVSGESRLDALLLATRIEHEAADIDGAAALLDAAELLALHQPEVAKVAEAEALIGNVEHAQRLMARLRHEGDQSRVLAAIVSTEAAAGDFTNADAHAAQISVDSYRSTALGTIALAHAHSGEVKEAVEQINAIPDDDARMNFQCRLTEMELKRHGAPDALAIATSCHDPTDKAVCLSIVAVAIGEAGQADVARKTLLESQAILSGEHDSIADAALAAVSGDMARLDMPAEALALIARIREFDRRAMAFESLTLCITHLHGVDAARKELASIADARERTFGLIGIAQALLDSPDKVAEGGEK